jgi:hypothetical protein
VSATGNPRQAANEPKSPDQQQFSSRELAGHPRSGAVSVIHLMKTATLLMDNRDYPSHSGRETLAAQRNNTRADTWRNFRRDPCRQRTRRKARRRITTTFDVCRFMPGVNSASWIAAVIHVVGGVATTVQSHSSIASASSLNRCARPIIAGSSGPLRGLASVWPLLPRPDEYCRRGVLA